MKLIEIPKNVEAVDGFWRATNNGPGRPIDAARVRINSNSARSTGHILVVDDSHVARRYLEQVLLRSGLSQSVHLAESGAEGLEFLGENKVDLVLCDVNMPVFSGFDFLTRVRADRATRDVPVIMLTGEQDFCSKIACLESGASDYLVKPVDEKELVARARTHLQLKRLQDELLRKNEQLAELARLDPLTKLPNRNYFFECAERELSRACRHQQSLALAMIDVDHFKRVNDEHGHLCGDWSLIETARLLKTALRDYDHIGRYGGEEFLALLVDVGVEMAQEIAERCRRLVADEVLLFKGRKLRISVSIGVALSKSPDRCVLNKLISRADESLYLAKRRGRNQVVVSPHEPECCCDPREDRSR